LIELNAPLLNAPDLLSLLPTLQAPVESTNTSAPVAQDFSALLTELIGPVGQAGLPNTASAPQVATLSATEPIVPEIQTPALKVAEVKLPEVKVPELTTPELKTSDVKTPELKTPAVKIPEVKVPELKVPELKTAELKTPELKTPEPKTPEAKTPEVKTPEVKVPELKVPESKVLEPKAPEVTTPKLKTPEAKTSLQPKAPEVEAQPARLPEALPLPEALVPTTQIVPNTPKGKEPQKAQGAQENSPVVTPLEPIVCLVVPAAVAGAEKPALKIEEPVAEKPVQVPVTLAPTKSEIDPVWAEVKKFELNIQREAAAPAKSQPAALAPPAEAPKQAMITSDPLVNIKQEQLPPRIIAVQKVNLDARLPERSKSDVDSTANEATHAPTVQFSDVGQPVEHIEQVRAAHHVEQPVVPQSQVVRTVAIEVGEADSQVMIRIQERGGDISVQLNAANEPLHHNLQSSLDSLVQSLRQDEVKVASAEVSRKSPIEKVRKSKEAH
jgi:hypothetical protein